MVTTKHQFIQNRADFFRVVDETNALGELLRGGRADPPIESIGRQLDAIKGWTANGRTPTNEERRSIQISIVIVRELDPAPNKEVQDYADRASEISFYFKLWWDDQAWLNMDEDDESVELEVLDL